MTTVNFPSSSSLDQEYTAGDKSWYWNGIGWAALVQPRATDAALRARASHTGTQAISTVEGLDAALKTLTPNNQAGTAYTLALADAGKRVDMASAAANTLTVPPNSSVAPTVDTTIFVSRGGAGATTIAPGSGVTTNTADGLAYQDCGRHLAGGWDCGMTADPLPQVIAQEVNLAASGWNVIDTARGRGTGSPKTTRLNGGGAEYSTDSGATKTTSGFTLAGLSDGNHIYMAIRKNI